MTYDHEETLLKDNDYARHVRHRWVDTHTQSIHTDPGIHLPGEVADEGPTAEEPTESDGDDDIIEAAGSKKRKVTTRSGNVYPAKIPKTGDGARPSTTAPAVIDDRRPDLTLVDFPIDEDIPSRPYGRHACLFIEVKIDPSKKPNPHSTVRSTTY